VRSTNNGTTWANTGSGLPSINVRALLSPVSYPFDALAGTNNGISKSSNYGTNWDGFPVDSVQPPGLAYVNSILKVETSSDFWIGTERGIYLLPHYYPLSVWIPYHSGLTSGEFTVVRVLLGAHGDVFAGTNSGVYKRNGSTWVQKNNGLTNTNVTALKSTGAYLVAGTRQGTTGGVYISSDNGENWALSKSDPWVTSILTIGPNIFVGSFGDGVWRSTNYGSTWGQINEGFAGAAYYVMSLDANGQFVFAGTNNANVWRRSLSQVTDVKGESGLPLAFSLDQNYPNPFNPVTTIRYAIPQSAHVTLKVYSPLGEEVATLVDGLLPAGAKTVELDASRLASGVYFYRLQAATYSETKKLLLVR
jgi:hypothetical protein